MHYLGFAIVTEPTTAAVEKVMAPFCEEDNPDGHWDWYRCGGRWDGWLGGNDEMRSRQTHKGFNFDAKNDNPASNACRIADLPADKRDVFFVTEGTVWIERESYVPGEGDGFGKFVETQNYRERVDALLAANPDAYVAVIDAHS